MIRISIIVLAAVMISGSAAIALAGDSEDCKNARILVKANPKKAVSACRRLAEQGQCLAQFNLGLLYDLGEGVPQSYAEAAKWYRKAADQGSALAQYNVFCHVLFRSRRATG